MKLDPVPGGVCGCRVYLDPSCWIDRVEGVYTCFGRLEVAVAGKGDETWRRDDGAEVWCWEDKVE